MDSLTLSLSWVINFKLPLSFTRNITSHSMKSLAFHSLTTWKIILLPIPTTALIHFSLKGWENVLFEVGSERAKIAEWTLLFQRTFCKRDSPTSFALHFQVAFAKLKLLLQQLSSNVPFCLAILLLHMAKICRNREGLYCKTDPNNCIWPSHGCMHGRAPHIHIQCGASVLFRLNLTHAL